MSVYKSLLCKEVFILAFSILLIGGCSFVKTIGGIPGYSEGQRSCRIEKISKKGLFFKSWEGRAQLGGMIRDNEGDLVLNIWEFSVSDENVALQLQDAAISGNMVTLEYVQWLVAPWRYSTDYDVVGVK